jgi:drug/metabolite transporter (DMT)-like permease
LAKASGYVLLVVLSVIWGMAFVAIRSAVGPPASQLTPVNLTLLRWLIVCAGFLVLYPFVIKPKTRFEWKDFPRLLVVGLTSVVIYHLALNTSETIVDASLAGLLISLGPLFIVLLSVVVLHEKLESRLWLAVALAIAGAAVISSPDLSLSSGTLLGPLLVVVAALASATFVVSSKPLVTKYGPFAIAAWAAFVGTAVLLPLLSPGLLQQAESLSLDGWAAVLYLSILSTVLANLIFFTLVHTQSVSRIGIQLYLVPVVSAVGGVLVLGESLGPATVAGGALILGAVALVQSARH